MKIKEFIEKVNDNDKIWAKKVNNEIIIVIPNSDSEICCIPEDATNLMEIFMSSTGSRVFLNKADREYISSLIEELLHTPVKERFPERKYYLCVFSKKEALEWRGENEAIWVNCIGSFDDDFRIDYGPKTAFTEETLNNIKKSLPFIAPAIDAMKVPVEEVGE